MWYLLILASLCLLIINPKHPPQSAKEDRFLSKCVFSAYKQFARTVELEIAFLPTGFRLPVIFPPNVVMYVMDEKVIKGEVWLKVSAQTTAGYECVGWIRQNDL